MALIIGELLLLTSWVLRVSDIEFGEQHTVTVLTLVNMSQLNLLPYRKAYIISWFLHGAWDG
jgi:hypothetical protein